ncbi:CLUMA_CG021058, isoform A [Clunio marinus]|uniref:CLUMA_CG021058, isoform A n=1 Tax=Clunio marinus TaxID=568069 RepID=A0A1J1J8H7_9DIPT|nr:CLUMA_CG021058, isoform A [Clunio marinus]
MLCQHRKSDNFMFMSTYYNIFKYSIHLCPVAVYLLLLVTNLYLLSSEKTFYIKEETFLVGEIYKGNQFSSIEQKIDMKNEYLLDNEESSPSKTEFMSESIAIEMNFKKPNFKIVNLSEIDSGVFNLTFVLNIPWTKDFENKFSEKTLTLKYFISHGIEDLYDLQYYSMDKSISANIERVDKEMFLKMLGVCLELEISTIRGEVKIL